MTERARARIGIVSGALFLGLLLAAVLLSGPHPAADASAAEIARHFEDPARRADLEILLAAIATAPAIVFLLVVWDMLRAGEGAPALWSHLVVLAGAIALAGNLASSVPHGVLAMSGPGRDPEVARALLDLGNVGLGFTLLPVAVLMGAVSMAGRASGVLPRWHCRLGGGLAVVVAISSFGVFQRTGPLAPNGPVSIAALLSLIAWGLTLWFVVVARLRPAALAPAPRRVDDLPVAPGTSRGGA
jgi:hypothetical protein